MPSRKDTLRAAAACALLAWAGWLHAAEGVTAQQVLVGQSITLQGGKNAYGAAVMDGVRTYLDKINAQGGVHGRQVVLRTLDDENQAAKAEANARPRPIPFYGELGSINPLIALPAALAAKGGELATTLAGSITLGCGQFCTNPGLLVLIDSRETDTFIDQLTLALTKQQPHPMLTPLCCNWPPMRSRALRPTV